MPALGQVLLFEEVLRRGGLVSGSAGLGGSRTVVALVGLGVSMVRPTEPGHYQLSPWPSPCSVHCYSRL
ncbi:UNVERIFIED_CONTAM: hypothetical protein Sradi_6827600 [Sesamum radiatum]|uniref:Uncharacterized protein n=1 Tax=Sesamum radiatum TaxID=300843 RepID=A0AAW2JSY2_SESRA